MCAAGAEGRSASNALDPLLCFDLYAASRAVTAAYRPLLADLGITYPQYLVLTVLWAHPERTVRQLADGLHLDHGTLTPLLRRMEDAGLVRRARGEDDQRTVVVTLGAAGERLRRHGSTIQHAIADAMGLDGAEVASLQAVLRRLLGHLDPG